MTEREQGVRAERAEGSAYEAIIGPESKHASVEQQPDASKE